MSGIPVFTNSPINPAKAAGSSPQTAAPPYSTPSRVPASNPAASPTGRAPPAYPSYPVAQPGAAAVPAPTSSAQRYAPLQPTPTTNDSYHGPPPPQPGAVPQAPSLRTNIPPPPKAGETYTPQTSASPSALPQPYPPQMGIPPPTSMYGAQPPASTTSASTSPSYAYPTALPLGASGAGDHRRPGSLEHPPGYVQNPYASDLTAGQRRALEAEEAAARSPDSSLRRNSTAAFGVDPESVWNTAKKWAQTAGDKISEAETEIWKRVNKE